MEILDRPLNHRFTQNYSQPEEYHFCLDSVLLPKLVADLTREKVSSSAAVLDLGAGCGVLGLEFLYYRPDIRKVDFIEKQELFASYFIENLSRFRENQDSAVQCEFLLEDLSAGGGAGATAGHHYDLILCNPPYYFADEGLVPPQPEKAQCHFFFSAMPADFLRVIASSLTSDGEAYVLVKNPTRWESAISASELKAVQIAKIRGTPVFKFTRS